MQLISVRLPKLLVKKIDHMAKKGKLNRSELIRSVLESVVNDVHDLKSDRLTEVRDELLLAVGQLGDSLRQLPKFIRRADMHVDGSDGEMPGENLKPTSPAPSQSSHVHVPTIDSNRTDPRRSSNIDNDDFNRTLRRPNLASVDPNSNVRSTSELEQMYAKKLEKASPKTAQKIEQQKSDQIANTVGWSTAVNVKPELTLRPRKASLDCVAEIIINKRDPDEPVSKPTHHESVVSKLDKNPSQTLVSKDRRRVRRDGQLKGRPIGEERRQSIRLARVLAYKNWDAQRLAERLRMPIEIIEYAIKGQKDLASLKVEALLSTWEEEMQCVGWLPEGYN